MDDERLIELVEDKFDPPRLNEQLKAAYWEAKTKKLTGDIASLLRLVKSERAKRQLRRSIRKGVCKVRNIGRLNPTLRDTLVNALEDIALGVSKAVTQIEGEREIVVRERARKIDERNQHYVGAKKCAREYASKCWAEDDAMRMGEMVKRVQGELSNRMLTVPVDRALRGWLRDLAPPSASRGGRPRSLEARKT